MSEEHEAKSTGSFIEKQQKSLLKEHKLRYSRPYRSAIFCTLVFCIFIVYWLIAAPALVSVFVPHNARKPNSWFLVWLILYWCFVFVIWILIMLCLLAIWRYLERKYEDNTMLRSYGTNDFPYSEPLIHHEFDPRYVTLNNTKEISNKVKKHKDLPPLVIHRRNSGNGIERSGTVKVGENVDTNTEKSDEDKTDSKSEKDDREVQRDSMSDYLELIPFSTLDERNTQSPKEPLSPRELFFIDLIREAEKAERNAASNPQATEGKHFFPSDFSLTKKEVKKEEKKPIEASTSKENGPVYFVADCRSTKREKSEVYLEIDPEPPIKEWSLSLNKEKPSLVLKNGSMNEEN